MSFILRDIFIFVFIIGNICADKYKDAQQNIHRSRIPIPSENGLMGVASVAGVMSRNGRLSSIGGIHFYSPLDKIPTINKSGKTSKQNKDLTGNMATGTTKWRKESNGNMAEGYISVYPGAVAVSSSVSRKPGNIGTKGNSWADPFNPMIWPMNDPFNGPARNLDYPHNIDWLHRDIFNSYVPPNLFSKRAWLYPTFNPFLTNI